MPYSDWLALIKELFLKKTALNQTVFYGIEVKFFASNFLISSWIAIKTVTNSQQKSF